MNKSIILLLTGLCINTVLFSQSKHEVSVSVGGGMSSLTNKSDIGKNKTNAGFSVGLGYNYAITDNWSIGTGLEYALYNGKLEVNGLSDNRYRTVDNEGHDFDFITEMKSSYDEKQKVGMLNIPIRAQFQLPVMGAHKFYASGGIKFGIPVTKTFEVDKADMMTKGYFPHLNATIDEPLYMGFGSFDRKGVDGDLDLKVAYILSLEAGMKWDLNQLYGLYTGIYFDYGLNNINKSGSNRLIEYNKEDPENFIHHSTYSSQYTVATRPLKILWIK